ncbi:hypothetical protein B0H14DRAFT_3144249 [Mycena olivaceomarginata]|nr:hypothetical protein B0H14DRAFT_3144249 [Mycena olivaceomarginata]
MWAEAINAKFFGRGKPYGKEEWDQLLGHCQAVTDSPAMMFAEERNCWPHTQMPRPTMQMSERVFPKDKLLEFEVKDGWGPLCAFLGKDIPAMDFPNTNDKEDVLRSV